MILTDDNFGTLVHAVELGRTIYSKIVSYIRYQMTQLLALVLLFVTATVFDINDGVAMTPLMVLFLNFFIAIFPVIDGCSTVPSSSSRRWCRSCSARTP
jgi:Ca2+-transporting ATPase